MSFQSPLLTPSQPSLNGPSASMGQTGLSMQNQLQQSSPSAYMGPQGLPMQQNGPSAYMGPQGLAMQNQMQQNGPSYPCSKTALYIIIFILLILLIMLMGSIYWYSSSYTKLVKDTAPETIMHNDKNFKAIIDSFNTTVKNNFATDNIRNGAIVVTGNQCREFNIKDPPLQAFSDLKLYALLMTTKKNDFVKIL